LIPLAADRPLASWNSVLQQFVVKPTELLQAAALA
jgi:hypothetical protein